VHLVQEFIEEYLATDVTLADLAALTGTSVAHFKKHFKDATGLPPHQYLIRQRVEKAKTLLSTPELTVAEVSHRVGFFDQSHFIRHFKSLFGVTPKEYRNEKGS
jgi:AraC family transcriptional regulator